MGLWLKSGCKIYSPYRDSRNLVNGESPRLLGAGNRNNADKMVDCENCLAQRRLRFFNLPFNIVIQGIDFGQTLKSLLQISQPTACSPPLGSGKGALDRFESSFRIFGIGNVFRKKIQE